MVNFETWLFSHLPQYFKDFDSYIEKGPGILERFVSTLGKDLDTTMIPKLTNFWDIHDVITTEDIYITYIAWVLGNPPRTFYDEASYRKLLKYVLDINKVKGTSLSYELLFGIMGIEVEITEHSITPLLYDSGLNYDSDEHYDLNCPPCSGYDLTLTDPNGVMEGWEENPLLEAMLNALIKYVEPINSRVIEFNYSSGEVPPPLTIIKDGLLFNWWAFTDPRFAPDGYKVPTLAEWEELRDYLGGEDVAGGKLKETGFIYWDSPNVGATNEVGFNGRGSGQREALTGIPDSFVNKGVTVVFASTELHPYWVSMGYSEYIGAASLGTVNDDMRVSNISGSYDESAVIADGLSIRYLKITPTASDLSKADGEDCFPCIGNDGKVYQTKKIGNQVWTVANSAETKFNDNSDIPEILHDPAWSDAGWYNEDPAMCAFNNDWSNVLES